MESWSPPLRGAFVALSLRLRGTFVASIGCLYYVGPLALQLVASNTWDLVASTLRRTFFVATLREIYALCYITSATSLFQTGLA